MTRAGLNTTQAVERIRAELPLTAEIDRAPGFHRDIGPRVYQVRYGLLAGNGRFPILALETARELGYEIVAIGIREEASKDIESLGVAHALDFDWRTQQADRHP